MKSTTLRRGVLVATAAALTVGGVTAAAGAAPRTDQLNINVEPYQLTLPAQVNGATVTKELRIAVYHDLRSQVRPATVTVDLRGISRFAQVTWPSTCTHVGGVGTCKNVYVNPVPAGTRPNWRYLTIGLTARKGVRSAKPGQVNVSATAPGLGPSRTQPTNVDVRIGADLVVNPPVTWLRNVKVGSTVKDPISWTNTGDVTVPRTQVTLQTLAGLSFEQHLRGCVYSDGGSKAVCVVNTPLKPGATLRLPGIVALRVTKQAWATFMTVQVAPLGAGRIPAPVDLNPQDTYSELDVTAVNSAHWVALGATAHGAAGKTVPMTIGVHSNGPAFVFDRSGGDTSGSVEAVFPPGTTVTGIPQNCGFQPKEVGSPLPDRYVCASPYAMAPGQTALFTFQVRVDKVVPHATGKVWLGNIMSDIKGGVASFPWDPSQAGHTASLVLN